MKDCKSADYCLREENNGITDTQIHLFAGAAAACRRSSECVKTPIFVSFSSTTWLCSLSHTHKSIISSLSLQFRDHLDRAYFMD